MPVQTWAAGQVLTAAEMTSITNMLLYPTSLGSNLNPAVAGNFYYCTTTLTLTLPSAPAQGDTVGAKLRGSGTVTINRAGSQVIYGPGYNGVTTIAISQAEAYVVLAYDGTNWQMIDSGGYGPLAATVATSETTTSTTFTDLATSGPAVTMVTNTTALITMSANLKTDLAQQYAIMGYAISGATTIAGSTNTGLTYITPIAGYNSQLSFVAYQTGLTGGSNTATAKYESTPTAARVATFVNRTISMLPLTA